MQPAFLAKASLRQELGADLVTPRGALFFEIPRLLKEFEPTERPPLVVLENVPNLLYGGDGGWFDQVRRALRAAGYWFREESCWTVNVKKETDIPQDRERLFMVAASKNHFSYNPFLPPPASNAVNASLRSIDKFLDRNRQGGEAAYLAPTNRYYKMIAQAMENGHTDVNVYQLRRSYVREKRNGLCPTLTANMGIGGHNVPFIRDAWGIRRLSVVEVARLQGFQAEKDLFPNIPEAEQYRLLGNSVCASLSHLVGRICETILSDEKSDD